MEGARYLSYLKGPPVNLNVHHYNPIAVNPLARKRSAIFLSLFPSEISPSSMTRKTPQCHIGIAFYTYPTSDTQWVLVLSENPMFEGEVWCNTAIETVNGWGAQWAPFDWSPAAFSPAALFSGVVHIAQACAPVNSIKAVIASENCSSELDRFKVHGPGDIPWGTEKYIILALWRLSLREEKFIRLQVFDMAGLAKQVQFRLTLLRSSHQTVPGNLYPVVSSSDRVSFGRSIP